MTRVLVSLLTILCHDVTGCSEDWMDLVIGSAPTTSGSTSIFSPTTKTALMVGLMSASLILASDLLF